MKPYIEEVINESVVIRTFSVSIDESELEWHWDEETRTVIALNENDWFFQFDNQLPIPFNEEINISAGIIHRIIKGTGDLKLKIIKHISE